MGWHGPTDGQVAVEQLSCFSNREQAGHVLHRIHEAQDSGRTNKSAYRIASVRVHLCDVLAGHHLGDDNETQ
jgi:hypothetical protein